MFSGIDYQYILNLVISVAIVLVATVFHEVAHAAMANALGDPTAKERGRLTLNPFAHLDPVGSVVLPILLKIAGGPVFAFAKPVPYNPHRLRHPVRDEVLVALAGPFANLIQALLGAGVFRLFMGILESGQMDPVINQIILSIFATYTQLNLMLMFFNLIPLPPLDGSAIISPFLRGKAREAYYQVQRYSMPVLLSLMFLVPMVFHIDPLSIYLDATANRLAFKLLGF